MRLVGSLSLRRSECLEEGLSWKRRLWLYICTWCATKALRLDKVWSRMSCKLFSLDGKTHGLWSSNPYVSWITNPIIKYSVVFQPLFQRLSFTFLFIFCLLSWNVKRGYSHSLSGLSLIPLSLLACIMHWFRSYFKIYESHHEKWRKLCTSECVFDAYLIEFRKRGLLQT